MPGRLFGALYDIERKAWERKLDADQRRQLRQQRAKPAAELLRKWLVRRRGQVPDGSAAAKAIDYSLGRSPHPSKEQLTEMSLAPLGRYIGSLRQELEWRKSGPYTRSERNSSTSPSKSGTFNTRTPIGGPVSSSDLDVTSRDDG